MRCPSRNIVLIGFASTGKSTTGRIVASRLGWKFVDIDDVVEEIYRAETGHELSRRDIFSRIGRDGFIDLETRALHRLEQNRETVIATGGGTPISNINRALVTNLGSVVYLNAGIKTIFNRMTHKGYPRYLGESPSLADLNHLWLERHTVYTKMADLVVDNTDKSPEETAHIITDRLLLGAETTATSS